MWATAFKIFGDVGDSAKCTKWQLSSLSHQLFEIFVLVPKSPIHTGLISAKTQEPNISSWGPS
jgi:hypothetical protein